MKNTLYEIATTYTDPQREIIDPFVEEAPLFQLLPCVQTTNADKNIFDIVKDVKLPEVVNFDAPVPQIYATTEKGYASLGKVGGRISIPLDKARIVSIEKLLATQLPIIFKRTGMAFDYSFMYNSLKKFCLENASECITKLGATTANSTYSMIGVTWGEGENCGLYNPALAGEKLWNQYMLSGGNIMNIKDKNGNDISGYVWEIVTFLGIQLARTDRIHALVNIDATHLPTAEQFLDFIYDFGGDYGNSMIFAHPKLINKLRGKYQEEQHHHDIFTVDANGNIRVDKTLIVKDPNMSNGGEPVIA